MNEHESNLYDLYAGLAMMGMLSAGKYVGEVVAKEAYDMADLMLDIRQERAREKEIRATDVAVPKVEEREDGAAAEGIAALKKSKTRARAV